MKQTINQSEFIDAFKGWDTYKDNFSYNGLVALYEYLEQYEEETGEEVELDVVALCCDYAEYDSAIEAAEEYGFNSRLEEGEEPTEEEEARALEWLQERTMAIEFDGGVIIQQF